MSVAKYTEEDVQALKIEANDRVRNLTKAMDAKYEKLELEMADTKAKAIRMERAYEEEKKRSAEIEARFNELLKRYNHKKESSEQLLQSAQKLKQQNEALQGKYNKLVTHAKDKLTDANVEIAKVKSNYENAENALKTRNALLKLEVQSLKSDFRCQSEELSAKERILSELIEQITPNVEC